MKYFIFISIFVLFPITLQATPNQINYSKEILDVASTSLKETHEQKNKDIDDKLTALREKSILSQDESIAVSVLKKQEIDKGTVKKYKEFATIAFPNEAFKNNEKELKIAKDDKVNLGMKSAYTTPNWVQQIIKKQNSNHMNNFWNAERAERTDLYQSFGDCPYSKYECCLQIYPNKPEICVNLKDDNSSGIIQ